MSFRSVAAEIIKQRPTATYSQIAREIGCSPMTVSQAAWKIGMPKRRLTREQSAMFEHLYANGLSDSDIAKNVGKDPASVFKWRKTNKLPPNKSTFQPATEKQRKSAVALVNKGYSYSAAARELGITRNAVAGAVNRARAHSG